MGLGKGLFRMSVLGFTFLLGYSYARHVYADKRYIIQRASEHVYLLDKQHHQRLELLEESFQLGSFDYRLQALLAEPQLEAKIQQYVEGGN